MFKIKNFSLFLGAIFFVPFTACDDYELEDYGACATCPPAQVSHFEVCNDQIDNDDDGLVDCSDPDCDLSQHCRVEVCDNGIDDDQDGFVDCNDPDCDGIAGCSETVRETVCDDGIDNDGDGAIDCDDPNCVNTVACRFRTETDCEDGQDNDQDGLTDCDDPSCQILPVCQNQPDGEENCVDGIDNDFDDAVDCDDSDCAAHPSCREEIVPSVLSFRPATGYRAGYCRDQDDTSWATGSACRGTVLLFTVYEGTTQFPNYSGTACRANTLVTGTHVAELHCEQGTDALTCNPGCFAICGPQRYAGGASQVSFLCVLDASSNTLMALANTLSNAALNDENLFVNVALGAF